MSTIYSNIFNYYKAGLIQVKSTSLFMFCLNLNLSPNFRLNIKSYLTWVLGSLIGKLLYGCNAVPPHTF